MPKNTVELPVKVITAAILLLTGYAMLAADLSESRTYEPSAISNHIAAVRKRVGAGFTVLWERPFCVVGDLDSAHLRFVSTNTVHWATLKLKDLYFPKDPEGIVDIWLFKDDASYRHHARALFGDSPTTPFGYYTPQHRALIMNIATGTGTLVHEMVHAFMPANFPGCPAWFNEGLASLYEQCGENAGRIHGYPNWRLPGLQQAIRDEKLPTFKQLTSTTTSQFYGLDSGAAYNEQYAQARYLCYHLQQRGLLVKFFRDFRDNAKTDPTGYSSLQRILEESNMSLFQKKWETEMLLLRRS